MMERVTKCTKKKQNLANIFTKSAFCATFLISVQGMRRSQSKYKIWIFAKFHFFCFDEKYNREFAADTLKNCALSPFCLGADIFEFLQFDADMRRVLLD